jgi:hypothetical protein
VNEFEYKYIGSAFSARKVLREVEAFERDGWSLYSLDPTVLLVFGSGGTTGMQAVMRRPLRRDTQARETG